MEIDYCLGLNNSGMPVWDLLNTTLLSEIHRWLKIEQHHELPCSFIFVSLMGDDLNPSVQKSLMLKYEKFLL